MIWKKLQIRLPHCIESAHTLLDPKDKNEISKQNIYYRALYQISNTDDDKDNDQMLVIN